MSNLWTTSCRGSSLDLFERSDMFTEHHDCPETESRNKRRGGLSRIAGILGRGRVVVLDHVKGLFDGSSQQPRMFALLVLGVGKVIPRDDILQPGNRMFKRMLDESPSQ